MGNRNSRKTVTKCLTSTLLASVALLTAGGTVEAGSIVDTVRAALQTNPEVEQVRADRRAVEEELRQARSLWFPSLDATASAGPERAHNSNTRDRTSGNDSTTLFRTDAELRLSQLLFDGFETQGEIERQRARLDSAARRVEEAAEFTAVDAVQAHLDVLRLARIVELNETNLHEHEKILAKVRRLERQGRGNLADVRQTEARVGDARASLETARRQLADARALYERVVGMPPEDLVLSELPQGLLPAGPEEAASRASVHNPTVLIAATDVDVAQAELTKARAGYYPKLTAELSARFRDRVAGLSEADDEEAALLVLRYNLFRGGGDLAREREAFHRLNEARANLAKARRQAEEEARRSFNALNEARARTEALRFTVEAQRRTRDAYAAQFDIGQRSLLDLLDAENQLFLFRVQLTTAEFAERFAAYRVLAVTGSLLSALDVAAPSESLDLYRTPGDEPTAERITEKSKPLVDPRMSPRPLRAPEEGAPPADDEDISPHVGRPPEKPVVPGGQAAAEPAADAPKNLAEASADGTAAPAAPAATARKGPRAEYESFQSFWKTVFGGS